MSDFADIYAIRTRDVHGVQTWRRSRSGSPLAGQCAEWLEIAERIYLAGGGDDRWTQDPTPGAASHTLRHFVMVDITNAADDDPQGTIITDVAFEPRG